MSTQNPWRIGARRWTDVLVCFLAIILGTACNASKDELGKYPAPPPTQELATLLARGIATARPEYPAPIPGPLSGPNPTLPPPTSLPTETLQAAVQASKYYLAGHLSLTNGEISLFSWEPAIWPSTSLGCLPLINPQETPTPGYRIILQAGGKKYELRSDQSGENICLVEPYNVREQLPLMKTSSPEAIAEMARAHLANWLSLPLDEISVVSVEPAEWEDEDLGCPAGPGMKPDRAYPRGIAGYRILLSAKEVQHEYHSGGLWLVYCGIIK